MEASRDQWREFHYGKRQTQKKKESGFHWTLFYNNNRLITGSYALCVWKMKQVIANERCNKKLFKIKPNE
jgi:hypothetical protein